MTFNRDDEQGVVLLNPLQFEKVSAIGEGFGDQIDDVAIINDDYIENDKGITVQFHLKDCMCWQFRISKTGNVSVPEITANYTLVQIGNSGHGKTHAWVNGNTACKAQSVLFIGGGHTQRVIHPAGQGEPTCGHCQVSLNAAARAA